MTYRNWFGIISDNLARWSIRHVPGVRARDWEIGMTTSNQLITSKDIEN